MKTTNLVNFAQPSTSNRKNLPARILLFLLFLAFAATSILASISVELSTQKLSQDAESIVVATVIGKQAKLVTDQRERHIYTDVSCEWTSASRARPRTSK